MAAMMPECMTQNIAQPQRKPTTLVQISDCADRDPSMNKRLADPV
jgi:hypothetical protein